MVRLLSSHLTTVIGVSSALLLAACQDDSQPTGPRAESPAPVAFASAKTEKIPGRYIVVFRSGVSDVQGVAGRLANRHGGTLTHVYTKALKGMALKLPDA